MSEQILVGDIGGTHARFAVINLTTVPWAVENSLDLETDQPIFLSVLRQYLEDASLPVLPDSIALAVAGPVTTGTVSLTNRSWHVTETELLAFGFKSALLINDFSALAFAVTTLAQSDLITIGPELTGLKDAPISILGAGTGFGVSCLARFRDRAVPMATEGGHAGFAPCDNHEIAVLQLLQKRFEHVSIERVLSGPGLENLYQALATIAGHKPVAKSAPEIVESAATDNDCRDAVQMFCAIYGSVAGDFALTHGARGGVYLAGGIAQHLIDILQKSRFRARFESKGRMSAYVKSIPTRLILNRNAAFLGAARASLEFRSSTSGSS